MFKNLPTILLTILCYTYPQEIILLKYYVQKYYVHCSYEVRLVVI